VTTAEPRVYGYRITGVVAHKPSGVPGVAVCGERTHYEHPRDERPVCHWCRRGVKRGRAQELRRIRKAAA
jgi:hypothetical protein